LLDALDEGEVDPDGEACPLASAAPLPLDPVVPEAAPAAPELVVTPELGVPALATPLVAVVTPLDAPEEVVAPLVPPLVPALVAPVEASTPPLSPSASPAPAPESSAISVPASTGVVAMPVAPQKRRYCVLVLVTSTPVSIAVLDGVSWMPSIVWPVGSTSSSVVFHFPVFVIR
jgi:hypothetical protein